jgi:CRISPR/Cas system-associated exonuclease Cas4 (RecB family)
MDMLGTYEKTPDDPQTLRVFENGHSTHERIQGWLEDMGLMIEAERKLISEELNISGSCDGVIELPGEGEFIIEIKTISAKGFRYLTEPKAPHYAQLQLYMYLAGVHQGILLYECKDDQRMKEFRVQYDEKFAKELVQKVKFVNECVAKNELPPKPFSKSSFECRYCPYRNTVCWK